MAELVARTAEMLRESSALESSGDPHHDTAQGTRSSIFESSRSWRCRRAPCRRVNQRCAATARRAPRHARRDGYGNHAAHVALQPSL